MYITKTNIYLSVGKIHCNQQRVDLQKYLGLQFIVYFIAELKLCVMQSDMALQLMISYINDHENDKSHVIIIKQFSMKVIEMIQYEDKWSTCQQSLVQFALLSQIVSLRVSTLTKNTIVNYSLLQHHSFFFHNTMVFSIVNQSFIVSV